MHCKTNNRSAGFSMIEVMVALLVLAIGLLGQAALQTTGIKFVHQSYQRSQATVLIYEIIDKMRANSKGLDYYVHGHEGSTALANIDCFANACNAAEVAAYDLRQWKQSVRNAIGSEMVEVRRNGRLYTITIKWREKEASQEQSINVRLEA